ncbi:ankyrin repeat domain-containing protein 16-like [Babylonia areolata]|uniref:ankyrin repeat domain-containing protein 16-like n=1 Tax=Babylonia areolata TaxID=304850 RepID=UPI003FD166DE
MEQGQSFFFDQTRPLSNRDPLVNFISMAARFGDVDTLRKLIQEAIATEGGCFLNSPTVGLALKRATQAGQVEVLRCLVETGVDINTEFKGASVLHEAVKINNMDVMRYLLSVPGLLCETLSTAQKTPVMEAACRGRVQCLAMLLAHGCGPETRSVRGLTAMHHSLLPSIGSLDSEDMVACLDLLCGKGADIDVQDRCGSTPLHLAIATENLEAVMWLLRHNCHLELESRPVDLAPGVFSCLGDQVAYTPLLLAIHFSNRRLVQLLVNCGARWHHLKWTLPYCQPYQLLHDYLAQCLTEPPSLQSLCRCVLRYALHTDIEVKVSQLRCLPQSVCRYILLAEELSQA